LNNKAKNSSYMKFVNRQTILNMIRREPVSRARLAGMTGLTRACVTMIVDELIKDELVLESGTSETGSGRRPVMLDINAGRHYAVGINISRINCSMGLVDLKGSLIGKRMIDLKGCKNAADALDIIIAETNGLISELCIDKDKIIGIGASTPGPVDIFTGTILDPPDFDLWHNVKLAEALENSLGIRVMLENISSARALAEKDFGAGKGYESFMLLVVDEGIGAGIVIDGMLYHGKGGSGSEAGHTTINIDGNKCSCGNSGCLETYASIPNILKEARKEDNITSWKEIVDRAESGDGFYKELVEKEARYLAAGIVNAMNLLELEAVIISGDINYRPKYLIDKIYETVNRISITRNVHDIRIYDSTIIDDPEIISSVSKVLDDFFGCSYFT
jgi:predicted NBD/HSP70 family sugar kinase